MATVADRLNAVVAKYDLLQHPFYVAWSAGTLPTEALRDYANDWAGFIALVPKGWAAHGDREIAAEEVEHLALWKQFGSALGVECGKVVSAGAQDLVATADAAFEDPIESMGALYAFEAQQPHTSKSKLAGLREHYAVGAAGEEYFVVHETDFAEPALLAERIDALAPEGQDQAVAACERVARALWQGLTDLHRPYCAA